MNFELIEFYPVKGTKKRKGGRVIGTAHIRAFDEHWSGDLRGILVIEHKEKIFLKQRWESVLDEKTKKNVSFAFFTFGNPESEKEFRRWMKMEGTLEVQKKILENILAKGIIEVMPIRCVIKC